MLTSTTRFDRGSPAGAGDVCAHEGKVAIAISIVMNPFRVLEKVVFMCRPLALINKAGRPPKLNALKEHDLKEVFEAERVAGREHCVAADTRFQSCAA
jgi:hypothetical protein